MVDESSALISRSIAWTRSRFESVLYIEPESSMIASMLVAFVHAAAAWAFAELAELGAEATAATRAPSITA